jgi:hypothetical protein
VGARANEVLLALLQLVGGAPSGTGPEAPGLLPLAVPAVTGGLRPSNPWDVLVSVEAPDVPGEQVGFYAVDEHRLVHDAVVSDGALEAIAAAVARALPPPYGAAGVRHDGGLWAVAAWSVELVELAGLPEGEALVAARVDGRVEVTIDGVVVLPSAQLHAVLDRRAGDVALVAERVDQGLWAVELAPL